MFYVFAFLLACFLYYFLRSNSTRIKMQEETNKSKSTGIDVPWTMNPSIAYNSIFS